jgi:aminoglycoside 6-adenylyltransferase
MGRAGRYLQRYLPPEMWSALGETCAGADLADNWRAFWRLIDLFRDVARQVGAHLGYDYPEDFDARVTAYLRHISTLERDGGRYGEIFATSFLECKS